MTAPYTRETAPPFLTVDQAAAILGCPKSAVYDAISQGRMRKAGSLTDRVIRIPREELWPETVEPLGFEDRRISQSIHYAHELARLGLAQIEQAVKELSAAEHAAASKAARAAGPLTTRKAA